MENTNFRYIDELKNWDKNPRNISEKQFNILVKKLIELGMFKPYLIDKNNIVYGGNMRLKGQKFIVSMSIEDVITYIGKNFTKENQLIGIYKRYISEFTEDKKELDINYILDRLENLAKAIIQYHRYCWVSVIKADTEEEKIKYALADNDRSGKYDDNLLSTLMPLYDIEWNDHNVDFNEPMGIQELLAYDRKQKKEVKDIENLAKAKITCPHCGKIFTR